MKRSSGKLKKQITIIVVFGLMLIWAVAYYEINRNYQNLIHEAEVRTAVQSHVFAEYSRSTLKRVNEFILDIRSDWNGDWKTFSAMVQRRQETLQVAVSDRDGLLAYSNLAAPTDRTDLSQREHFRVHKEAGNADKLFISKPLKGKVSGKWSIQITRPIFKDGEFNGVLVVSVSPEQFAGFAKKLLIAQDSSLTVVRSTGEIMARYPAVESSLGMVLKGAIYLTSEAPGFGNFTMAAAVDNVERIYGYYRLPEYGMTFVLGEAVSDVLKPYFSYRRSVTLGALGLSVLAISLFIMLFRSLSSLVDTRRQLDAIFSLSPDGFVSFDHDRHVKYISPTFIRMTGLTEVDVLGLSEYDFSQRLALLCVQHSRFPGMAELRSAQSGSAAASANAGESGHRQFIEMAGAGKRVLEVGIRVSDSGKVSQILYLRDVTHETEVDRMKSEFLSTAAHELRTPMASIFGYSELMLAEDFPKEERHEFLGIIYRQSELMIAIINELLDLVRIEERRVKKYNIYRL